jgi:hypothetical protein
MIAGRVPGSGLQGAYYNDGNFSSLVLTRTDPGLNFSFGANTPAALITNQTYSIRWTGIVAAPAGGTYTFYTHSPNSVRVWIQGNLIIDNWNNPNPAEQQGTYQIPVGLGGALATFQVDFMELNPAFLVRPQCRQADHSRREPLFRGCSSGSPRRRLPQDHRPTGRLDRPGEFRLPGGLSGRQRRCRRPG